MNPDQQSNYWKPDADDQPATPVIDNYPDASLGDHSESAPAPDESTVQAITWEADEYIHHEKDGVWFFGFAVITLLMLALAIFLIKSITFTILVIVMAVAVIVLSKRPPRRLKYMLSTKGLHVSDLLHPLSDYKSFGVIRDEGHFSIMLVPTKRFWPGLTIYFPADRGEEIVDFLGSRLPMEELHLDLVDRLVRKLRL